MNDSLNQIDEEEISVKDIIDFLSESWKTILAAGSIGLFLAVGYLWITPSMWEASAQIQMAQVGTLTNPVGANIEEPTLLISRMKIPTSYEKEIIQICGLENKPNATESMVKLVKLAPVKGLNSVVELKLALQSKESAKTCAESLYQVIKKSQENITAPLVQEAQAKLDDYAQRLVKLREILVREGGASGSISVAYFATRDEIKYLNDETMKLNDFISSAQKRQTKLLAPIYVADKPTWPKKTISLLAGLFGGLCIGFVWALGRKVLARYRNASLALS
jgi:uncharacterized protein involved in exopolysaccharide biosynthesis